MVVVDDEGRLARGTWDGLSQLPFPARGAHTPVPVTTQVVAEAGWEGEWALGDSLSGPSPFPYACFLLSARYLELSRPIPVLAVVDV